MSYTKTYTTNVSFSKSKNVHYPASEHGGMVNVDVTGTVPIQINIEVDTEPFDRSVNGTNAALIGVAAAVGTLEAAQVASINAEAQRVADCATKGFFRIIGSEMSTRVASFSSAMQSSVALLAEEGKSIERVHRQMEADYAAIKARYVRIFNMLDQELDRRIKELDRPAFVVSSRAMGDVVQKPFEQKAAQAITHVGSAGTIPTKLSCAHAKSKAVSAIRGLATACNQIGAYVRGVGDIMEDGGRESLELQPVVYSVQQSLGSPQSQLTVHAPDGDQSQEVQRRIAQFVGSCPREKWSRLNPQHQQELDAEYLRLVESYTGAGPRAGEPEDTGVLSETVTERQRVSQLMISMYKQAQTRTCYRQ